MIPTPCYDAWGRAHTTCDYNKDIVADGVACGCVPDLSARRRHFITRDRSGKTGMTQAASPVTYDNISVFRCLWNTLSKGLLKSRMIRSVCFRLSTFWARYVVCLCGVVWNASSYPRGGATVLSVAKNIKTVSKCRSPLSDAVYCGLSPLKMPPKKPVVAKATGKASTKLAPGKGAVKKSTKTTVAGSGTTGGRQHEMRPKSNGK